MKYLPVAIKAAKEAGGIIRKYSQKQNTYFFKSSHDVVTEVDFAAEKQIIKVLRTSFPDHSFMAEESGKNLTQSPFAWVIDPLDGTSNFVNGLPEYSVSVALTHKGKVIAGVIYHPILDRVFTAEQGKGSFSNGKRIRVSEKKELVNCTIATDNSSRLAQRQRNFDLVARICTNVRQIRIFGGTALHMARVAAGELDGYFTTHTNYWDFAAGSILIAEAGGKVADLAGKKLSQESDSILTGNASIYKQLYSKLKV